MDKWKKSRGKKSEKWEVNQEIKKTENSDIKLSKKKGKKWSIGGLFRKISRQEPSPIISGPTKIYQKSHEEFSEYLPGPSTPTTPTNHQEPEKINENIKIIELNNPELLHSKIYQNHGESQEIIPPIIPPELSKKTETILSDSTSKSAFKNRKKGRIQSKHSKINSNNSSSDENCKNSISSHQNEENTNDNNQKFELLSNKKRSRGARTERYMKRIYRDDQIDPELTKKKYLSDSFSPNSWTLNYDSRSPTSWKKSMSYRNNNYPSYNSDMNISLCPTRGYNCYPHIQQNECCHHNNNQEINWENPYQRINKNYKKKNQPPEPPPRSYSSKLIPAMRYSLQHSDIENYSPQINNVPYNINCNSLDRSPPRKTINSKIITKKNSQSVVKTPSPIEDPIVPEMKARNKLLDEDKKHQINEKKRQSKNLEEALQELETIYNSLRLGDEDLLDRAEKRSMDEYRDKLLYKNKIDESMKSMSDTSSTRELIFNDDCYDYSDVNTSRIKDDMAYRRMNHSTTKSPLNDRQSAISYLATSPILSPINYNETINNNNYYNDKPKSTTPDLMRDDVAFRCIKHSINTLKIEDPQPLFGIPIGPVTGSAESDYLHVDPVNEINNTRSVYIPHKEPDIVTDDLAFRNLRKDKNNSNVNDMNKLNYQINNCNDKKKKAVRSMSADIYGIIDKNKQTSWYKEYCKLNRPSRVVEFINKYQNDWQNFDVNGNDKIVVDDNINCQDNKNHECGRRSVELGVVMKNYDDDDDDDFSKENSSCDLKKVNLSTSISDKELSEYKQLCRDLENLIIKTSEQVKLGDELNAPEKNSLDEFVQWEEIVQDDEIKFKDKIVEEINQDEEELMSEINTKNINDVTKIIIEDESEDEIEKQFQEIYESTDTKMVSKPKNVPLKNEDDKKKLIDINSQIKIDNNVKIFENDDKCHNIDVNNKMMTSSIEGEIYDNKCTTNNNVNKKESIMNFCFVTNCLTTCTVALLSMFLTLLIAIIVALSKK